MRGVLFKLIAVALTFAATASAHAQESGQRLHLPWYTMVKPWHEGSAEIALQQSASVNTIPLAGYTINSTRDGNDYSGTIVGRNPLFHGARTTSIRVFIIPLVVVMPDTGRRFDPTQADPRCLPPRTTPLSLSQASPIFQAPPNDWIMNGTDVGTGQYNDAFQRAEFFNNVSITGSRYHTVLSVVTLGKQTFQVATGQGATYNAGSMGGCGFLGVVDLTAMDDFVAGILIPGLAADGVGPANFPIFLLYNVVMGAPGTDLFTNCCVVGYHGAFGSPLQTYSPVEFDTTDLFIGVANTSIFAHEIGEWLNDPTGNNPTPAWGHIGQLPDSCQATFEVGDPLSGTDFPPVTMPNGFTYQLQELAYFSWFYGAPSVGAGGVFSNNGSFDSDAGAPCT